jgi:hypothetical protein
VNEISTSYDRPLTLRDVRGFLDRCAQLGIAEETTLRAVVAWGGKVKKLTVREEPAAKVEP